MNPGGTDSAYATHCSLLGTAVLNPGDRQPHTAALSSLTQRQSDGTAHWTPGFLGSKHPTELSTHPPFHPTTPPLSPPPPPASFSSHSSPLGGIILLYCLFSLFTIIKIYKVTASTELANIEPWLLEGIQGYVPMNLGSHFHLLTPT